MKYTRNLILPEKNRSDLDDSKKWCEFKMKLVRAREREKSGKALPRATPEKSPALRSFLAESQPTPDTQMCVPSHY